MKPTHFSVLALAALAAATTLIALGKLPVETFLPLVTGLLGWTIPSPVKKPTP